MGLIELEGKNPDGGGLSLSAGADGEFKVLGYSLREWNEVIENIKQLMSLRGGIINNPPPPQLPPGGTRIIDNPGRAAPVPGAPAASKADIALKQLSDSLKIIVDGGGGEAKLVDILNQSNFTIKQLHDILQKALQ